VLTTSQQTAYSAALEWLALGVGLLPLQPKSKHIVRGWGPTRRHIVTEKEAALWYLERRFNVAVVCGTGDPGRLVCLDFDNAGAYQAWAHQLAGAVRTRIESTARGYHVFFFSDKQLDAAAVPGLELKTTGAVMTAPSVHQSGAVYVTLSAGPIAPLDWQQLAPLFPAKPPPALSLRPLPMRGRTDQGLISSIKRNYPVLPLAMQFTTLRQSGPGSYWHGHCPFHDDQRASFWVDAERNLWGCMAASCEQQGTHDIINLFAAVHHLSLTDAIRELAGGGAW